MQNPQILYQRVGTIILKIQVVDSSRRKLFKTEVNLLDKEKVARVFETIKLKFSLEIPQKLKEEVKAQNAWDGLSLG